MYSYSVSARYGYVRACQAFCYRFCNSCGQLFFLALEGRLVQVKKEKKEETKAGQGWDFGIQYSIQRIYIL